MKSRFTFLQPGRLVKGLTFLVSLAASVSCTAGSDVNFSENSPERAFLMGLSPWPYDATYDDGDIISQLIEQGVPWAEAYNGDPSPQAFQDEVKAAYLNYAKRMIDSFDPDYLILGIEVNLLMSNSPSLWASPCFAAAFFPSGLPSMICRTSLTVWKT